MTTHQHPAGRHDADAHRDGAATAVLEVSGVQWATSKNVAEAVLSRQPGVISVDANPVAQTARDLGISESCLRNWINRDAVDSGRKPGLTTDEHKELVELRRRLRVLEMENEILKRASAYFARENVLPK